jgi:hypothetical protein
VETVAAAAVKCKPAKCVKEALNHGLLQVRMISNRLRRQKVVGITHRQDYYNACLFTGILPDEHSDCPRDGLIQRSA